MAREAIKENFRDSRYVEGKRRNIVLMPHVKVIRRNKKPRGRKPSNLYVAYVEFLDSLGLAPEDITVKKVLQCMAWTGFAWLMVVMLAV